MTDPAALLSLPAGTVRVQRDAGGIALYFPPLRTPEVAAGLGAFGLIATILPALALVALWPAATADAAGMLAGVFLAAIILPFTVFGVIFVALAGYMLCNALLVRIERGTISTTRSLFGLTLRRAHLPPGALARLTPEIPTRLQSLFGSEPVYQIVAVDARGQRLVVAESLRGAAQMEAVKGLIEDALALDGAGASG